MNSARCPVVALIDDLATETWFVRAQGRPLGPRPGYVVSARTQARYRTFPPTMGIAVTLGTSYGWRPMTNEAMSSRRAIRDRRKARASVVSWISPSQR